MELVKVNGELHLVTSLESAYSLVDEHLGRELVDCLKEMHKEEYEQEYEELQNVIDQRENLLDKRHNQISMLLRKVKELKQENKLDADDYFHLKKDKEYINQQYETLRKGTEKLLDYLYSAKRIDKKKIIAQLENILNSGENVPLF